MALQEISRAFTYYHSHNEGALIAFDLGEKVLFFKGSAVVASRLLTDTLAKDGLGNVILEVPKERALALQAKYKSEGKKFLMLKKREGGDHSWQLEAIKADLSRFIRPHELVFEEALGEIKKGCKVGHWIWYIFPQLKGLGFSENAEKYGIKDLEEAKAFLRHPYLGKNLTNITKAVWEIEGKSALEIFGEIDTIKLRSSMTLFSLCRKSEDNVFKKVLEKYFNGEPDKLTLSMLGIK